MYLLSLFIIINKIIYLNKENELHDKKHWGYFTTDFILKTVRVFSFNVYLLSTNLNLTLSQIDERNTF